MILNLVAISIFTTLNLTHKVFINTFYYYLFYYYYLFNIYLITKIYEFLDLLMENNKLLCCLTSYIDWLDFKVFRSKKFV